MDWSLLHITEMVYTLPSHSLIIHWLNVSYILSALLEKGKKKKKNQDKASVLWELGIP